MEETIEGGEYSEKELTGFELNFTLKGCLFGRFFNVERKVGFNPFFKHP